MDEAAQKVQAEVDDLLRQAEESDAAGEVTSARNRRAGKLPGEVSPPRVTRYRFAPEILKRVWRCRHTDNYHGLREWAEDRIVIAASTYFSILAWKALPWALSLPIYLVSIFLIGGRQRALADILHQAAHRTLVKNRVLNDILGTFLSGYLILQSFSGYHWSHIRRHHAFLGHPELDPDYRQYQLWNICGADMNSAAVRSHLLRSLSPGRALAYLRYLITNRIFPAGEDSKEKAIRMPFITIVTCSICVLGYGHVLLLYWLIPLITTQAWIGAFLELVEHYPMIETGSTVDIYMSRNRRCGWVSSFLLGLQQYDGYHLVHHKFPFVPSWRLPEVHQILMEDEVYKSLNQVYGWKSILRTLLNPKMS